MYRCSLEVVAWNEATSKGVLLPSSISKYSTVSSDVRVLLHRLWFQRVNLQRILASVAGWYNPTMHRALAGARASTERPVCSSPIARSARVPRRCAVTRPMIGQRSANLRRGDLCKASEFKEGDGEPAIPPTPEVR